MKIKLITLVVSLFLFQNSFAQYTDVINSNRPGESMSAFSVGKTVIQIETGLNYIKEKHSILEYSANGIGLDFNVRYGLFREQMEAILEVNYQKDSYSSYLGDKKRTGLRSTDMGLKYLFYDPFKYYEEKVNLYSWKANHKLNFRQFIPAVAGYAGFNLNFSSNQFAPIDEKLGPISPRIMLITQNQFPGAFVFVTNIFIEKISTNNQSIGYIATLTKGFNDKWSAFLENKAIKGDYYADGIFRTGAAYLYSKNLQIDASISKNYKDTPYLLYGGFGISWRSDTNYKEVMIKSKKKDKSTDGKKGKKGKADKKKKRLDEVQLEKKP